MANSPGRTSSPMASMVRVATGPERPTTTAWLGEASWLDHRATGPAAHRPAPSSADPVPEVHAARVTAASTASAASRLIADPLIPDEV